MRGMRINWDGDGEMRDIADLSEAELANWVNHLCPDCVRAVLNEAIQDTHPEKSLPDDISEHDARQILFEAMCWMRDDDE